MIIHGINCEGAQAGKTVFPGVREGLRGVREDAVTCY